MTRKELSDSDRDELYKIKSSLYRICARHSECKDCPFGIYETCPFYAIAHVLGVGYNLRNIYDKGNYHNSRI